jgi:putative peptidoglycan lipid II flippase
VVSASVFLSRITGLMREVVMASRFGAGLQYDAFLLGFRIPNLTRDLFAEGALSSAFVPTFTHYLTQKSRKEAAELSNLVATAILIFVGAFCLLGVIFSPQIVAVMAAGWAENSPDKYRLAVWLTRIMFPFLLLVSLAAQVMGVLNANNQFGVPALASSFFNIGSVAFGLFLGFRLGPSIGISPIEGMAWGVVFGGALQLAWQLPAMKKAGFLFRPRIDFSHPGLRHIIKLMGPAILGNAAVQVNVMVNTYFATTINDPVSGADGPVSWLGFAFRFMQLPLGLFGVAIASATLPSISRSASSGDIEEFRRTLSRSVGVVFLLTVPSSVGLIVLGRSMICAIYEHGRFNSYDTQQTAVALACYAIGLAGYSAVKVLVPAFYALKDARTPMIVSLASILINFSVAGSILKMTSLGHAGLALSTSAVALFSCIALFWILRNRIGGIHGRDLLSSFLKISFAAAAMGLVAWVTSSGIEAWLGVSKLARLTDLAVSIPIGLVVFYAMCRFARVPEVETATNALALPVLGRFTRRANIE